MTPIEQVVFDAYKWHFGAPPSREQMNAYNYLMRQMNVLPLSSPSTRYDAAKAWALCEFEVRG